MMTSLGTSWYGIWHSDTSLIHRLLTYFEQAEKYVEFSSQAQLYLYKLHVSGREFQNV